VDRRATLANQHQLFLSPWFLLPVARTSLQLPTVVTIRSHTAPSFGRVYKADANAIFFGLSGRKQTCETCDPLYRLFHVAGFRFGKPAANLQTCETHFAFSPG
jgi:hypothetical protein